MIIRNYMQGEGVVASVPVIILIGPPGCGKGTQGDRLAQAWGFPKISTGDLLRDEVALQTELGIKISQVMAEGGLVDDADVLAVLAHKIKGDGYDRGFILDGFPRNIEQADGLQRMLDSVALVCRLIVFHINVSESVVVDRLSNRCFCKKCKTNYNKLYKSPIAAGVCDVCGGHEFDVRDDDRSEVIRARLRIYYKQTQPVLEYYSKQNVLEAVSGDVGVETVSLEINNALGKLLTY